MSILGDYLRNDYNGHFFIEIEGKESNVNNVIDELLELRLINSAPNDGIVWLRDDQNKYGLEYRLYLENIDGLPESIGPITNNRVYRKEYPYRLSKKMYVRPLLFEDGYRLGFN